RRSVWNASAHKVRDSLTWSGPCPVSEASVAEVVGSVIANPRVQDGVDEIDDQHDHHSDDRQHRHNADDNGDVAILHRRPQYAAHAVDVHHAFGDHRTG